MELLRNRFEGEGLLRVLSLRIQLWGSVAVRADKEQATLFCGICATMRVWQAVWGKIHSETSSK